MQEVLEPGLIAEESVTADRELVRLDLLQVAQRLHRARWRIMLAALVGLMLGIALALLLPPYFEGHAVFLPPKNTDMLSFSQSPQLSASSLLLGGGTSQSDTYLGFLASRTVADRVIDRVGLMKEFKAKKRVDAEVALAKASNFKVSKNSLIEVTVKARTPQLAANITNAYLDALFELNGQMATSGSAFRRNFFEQQLREQKQALEEAENALKSVQQSSGVVLPMGEAMAGISATAGLQAQIGQAETRLAGLTAGATDQNPQVVQARRELGQLRQQLAAQQADENSKGLASNRSLPGVTLAVEQRTTEVKLRMTLYEAMVAEYERARVSAMDPGPQLQVVDRAVVPERKAGPPRTLLAIVGLLLGFLLGVGYVVAAEPLARIRRSVIASPDDSSAGPAR